MATANPLTDQMASESDYPQEEDDLIFQTVMSPKEKRKLAKRKRQGSSPHVENITRTYSTSDTDIQDTIFQTPMKLGANKETEIPDLKILIAPIDKTKNLRNTSPLIIAKAIQANCGAEPAFIKPISTGILVACKNIKQFRSLKQIGTIGNTPVKVIEKVNGIKGVIHGVPLEMTEAEITNELKSQRVTAASRMSRKNPIKDPDPENNTSQQRSPTKSVIITFDGTSLPPQIRLCFQIFTVKQYIPPPLRCFKCQRYGHSASYCRYNERCVRCGDPHSFEQCPQKESPKCINCGGKHSAAYGGCQKAKAATEIQKVRIENKISYVQATKLVIEKATKNKNKSDSEGPNEQSRLRQTAEQDDQPGASSDIPNRDNKTRPNITKNHNNPSKTSTHWSKPNTDKSQPQANLRNKITKNILQEKMSTSQSENIQIKNPFTTDNGDKIITLIMAIISVFIKDMNKLDEMYNINMIKAAAERLLQIKENDFINDENV